VSVQSESRTSCPSCGTSNPARYRLCGSCGTRLAAPTSAHAPRRFVTIVTSDLKGSTALGEKLDPESLREILSRYFDEMRLVFESHGGTIEKIIGDAIFTVFGLPAAADDDALRGVEAAAESQRVLASLNEQLDEKWGVRLVNRTGIASGEVVVAEPKGGEHVLTGEVLKVATTMEQNAPPFEVLAAESTVTLAGERVAFEPLGPVSPKDGHGEYAAYRLVAVAERAVGSSVGGDGEALAGACPRCGEVNAPGFRLCGYCGSPLASRVRARESRKTVTIVFADPKLTPLGDAAPTPEALRDAMAAYFEAMRTALERHGATIETFIGDAVMAVFGLPVRHEDDAIRAIRAAADMQAALPALNAELRSRFSLEIGNHIGVNTGEVIAGDASLGQRLVTGDAVNTAARLEQAAGDGQIILGGLTYRLARDQIDVEVIPPLSLKGKAEPVPAYRFLGVRARPAEEASGLSPFVGREAEMTRLSAALDDARAHRAARLVAVVGDAGVGKSRLIKEFAAHASREARVVRGRCLPYGDGITFWPIAEIVREAAGIGADDPLELARSKIANLVADGVADATEGGDITDRVAVALGLSQATFPVAELFWGIRRLFEALAAAEPLVVIVDDIHSAETTLLDLLDHLLDAVTGAPILLLCSARHELLDRHPEWSTRHAERQVILQPLDDSDAGRMIEQLLGEVGLSETIRERVVAAAEGNPLFVEQMVGMLVDDGVLRRDGARWVAVGGAASIVVPPTIHALLAARLDNLGGRERDVVEPASVVGLYFAQAAVEELVAEPVRPVVQDELVALSRKQFVRPETADGEPAFRFGHQLIRDTAYGSLLKRERVGLHERFVTWAERVNKERGRETEFEEILGYHLEQAYRYRAELGPIDHEGRIIGERAATKLASAGRRALARADMPAAANLLRRSTALLPEVEPLRVELLLELAEAHIELGEYEAAGAAVQAAIGAAERLEDERLLARSLLSRVFVRIYAPAVMAAPSKDESPLVQRAIRTLEDEGDYAGLARAWRVQAMLSSRAGRYDDVARAAEHLIENAAKAGEPRLVARGASGYANQAVWNSQPVADLTARIEGFLDQVQGDRKAEANIALGLAQLHAMKGEFERARQLYRRGQVLLRDLGPSVSAMTTSIASARVEALAGALGQAEAELRRDEADLARIDERYYRSSIAGALARVLLLEDNLDEAARFCQIAQDLADPEDTDPQVLWRSVRARILALRGEADEAVRLVEEAVQLTQETEDVILKAEALVDQSAVLQALGRSDAAGPPLRAALQLFEEKGDVISARRLRLALADAAPASR